MNVIRLVHKDRQGSMILIAALVATVMLLIMLGAFMTSGGITTRSTTDLRNLAQAREAAVSGLEDALVYLDNNPTADPTTYQKERILGNACYKYQFGPYNATTKAVGIHVTGTSPIKGSNCNSASASQSVISLTAQANFATSLSFPQVQSVQFSQKGTDINSPTLQKYKDNIIQDNPTNYWRLDQASAAQATNEINSAPACEYQQPAVIQGQAGALTTEANKAIEVSGASPSYIDCNTHASFNSEDGFALEAWFRPDSINREHTIISKTASNTSGYALSATSSNTFRFSVGDGDLQSATGGAMSRGAWYHVVGVQEDNGHLKLYVNGNLAGEYTNQQGSPTGSADLNIGRSSLGVEYADGWIDEVAMYGEPLTAYQVKDHWQGR